MQVLVQLDSFKPEHAHDVLLGFAAVKAELSASLVASLAAKLVQNPGGLRLKTGAQALLAAHSLGDSLEANTLQQAPEWSGHPRVCLLYHTDCNRTLSHQSVLGAHCKLKVLDIEGCVMSSRSMPTAMACMLSYILQTA